jgi:uncharacterized protein (DUF4415 family)
MKRRTDPERIDEENPEWTREDLRRARPASQVLPEIVGPEAAREMLKPRGRPKGEITKVPLNIRVDADVVAAFKATGRGWQTRMNVALRDWLKEHSAA